MGSAGYQALAEILLAVVAIGSILMHVGKKNQGQDDIKRRVENLEEKVDDHSITVSQLDKGLALLNQTIGQLNETLASFPCRVPSMPGHRRVTDCRDLERDN